MQTSWPGGMRALVGWEIFSDESAACQEKCAAFKHSERRLKEKERWGKEGRALGLGRPGTQEAW